MAKYKMLVTPNGVKFPARSWQEIWSNIRTEAGKIRSIIGSEVRAKVFDKTLGMVFLVLEPLLMATVYWMLTMVILGSRLGNIGFLNIYIAVVFWRWFSRTVDNSPSVFTTYAAILKQTNFPVFSIIASFIGSETVNILVGIGVLFVMLLLMGEYPSWVFIFLPFVMLVQLSVIVFFATLFSTLGAFFKDLQGLLYAAVGIWFYLSPGIYPVSNIPKELLWIYYLNPFAHIIPAYRSILLKGEIPDLLPLVVILILFSTLAVGALELLRRARYYFFPYL